MSSSYTYSISTDFPNGLNNGQLAGEIIADTNITPVLLNVGSSGDVVNIVFASSLSAGEITELNTLIANHVPLPDDNIFEYEGRAHFISSLGDPQALALIATDADGGIWLNSQNGGIALETTGPVAITSSGDTMSLDASSLNIGNDEFTSPINIGTTSFSKVVNIGNVTGTTSVGITAGSSGITMTSSGGYSVAAGATGLSIGNDGTAHPITIGNATGASSMTIQSGTGNIDIGVESVAKAINIGNTTAGTSVSISTNNTGAGGNIIIASSGSSATTTVTSVGSVVIGNGSTTAINLNPGSGGLTVGGTGTINVGTTGAGRAVNIGNTGNATNLSLRWGSSGGFMLMHQPTPTALANAAVTLTMDNNSATGILNRILSGTPTLGRNLTLPTAANAVAALSGVQVNDSLDFSIVTLGALATFTLQTNTGATIVGGAGIASSTSSTFRMHFTNVSGGSEAYTVYKLS